MVVLYYILALLGQIGAAFATPFKTHAVRESRVAALVGGNSAVQMAAVAAIMDACGVSHRPVWACSTFYSPTQKVGVKTRTIGGVERNVKTRSSGVFNTRRQALIWSTGPVTLWHELCHALQTEAMLSAKAPASGNSYLDMPCEIEARAVEALMVLSHHYGFWPAMASLPMETRGDCHRVAEAMKVHLGLTGPAYTLYKREVESRYPGNFSGCPETAEWCPKAKVAKEAADKAAEAAVKAAHAASDALFERRMALLEEAMAANTAAMAALKEGDMAAYAVAKEKGTAAQAAYDAT